MEDCKIKLNLLDKPGELSRVLDVIAQNNGNLFSVNHIREVKREGYVPVVIQFQATQEDFAGVLKGLEDLGIEVLEKRIGGTWEAQRSNEFLLIGHIIDTDIRDTLYRIWGGDVIIRSLNISLKSLRDPSSAFIKISAKSQKALDDAMKKMEEIAKEKHLLLITSIET